MAEKKTSLHWFPSDPAKWLTDPSVLRMNTEQIGAWWLLSLVSWGDGSSEPSLPADEESLAFLSRLGDRWRKIGAPIRSMLVERDGRLYCPGWTELWHLQQAKYAAASGKGGRGGVRKAENARGRKQISSSATAQLETPGRRPRSHSDPTTSSSALAQLEKSASSARAQLQPSSSLALAEIVAENVAIEGSVLQNLGPSGAPLPAHAAGPGSLDAQYELAIGAKVEEYRQAHPDEAATLETDVRAELRVSRNRLLTRYEQLLVHERMLAKIDSGEAPPLRLMNGGSQ